MNNQVKLKSSLTRAETLEGLDDVTEMSDADIAKNAEAIRHLAASAHMHITRIGSDIDKLKRQLKARPKADTPPVPTIKPGDKVRHKDWPLYGIGTVISIAKSGLRARVEFKDAVGMWGTPLDAYYLLDKLEVVE